MIVRPNGLPNSVGNASWKLKKYTSWAREYAVNGGVDFMPLSSYVDSDGDEWDIAGGTNATEFELRSDGLYIDSASISPTTILMAMQSVIPGFDPMDKIWCLFRANVTTLNNTSNVSFRVRRNETNGQAGYWEIAKIAGTDRLNPGIKSDGTDFVTPNSESLSQQLLSIDCSGLYYAYRKQSSSSPFPATPSPSNINLFSGTNFNGYYSGRAETNADTRDVNASECAMVMSINNGTAVQTVLTWKEAWIYRYE